MIYPKVVCWVGCGGPPNLVMRTLRKTNGAINPYRGARRTLTMPSVARDVSRNSHDELCLCGPLSGAHLL